MTLASDAASLAEEIRGYIVAGRDDEDEFDRIALRLFAYQFYRNAPYRSFCEGRDAFPGSLSGWRQIPAAPAVAFKRFALSAAPEEECLPVRGGRVFHSSGTTGAETSRHFLDAPALDLYRVSLRAGYRRFVLPDGAALPVLALMAPPEEAPHSSLSFMLGELIAVYGGRFFWEPGWQEDLRRALTGLQAPVVVFGTAFAWIHFFDAGPQALPLPPGSRIVETGGFKGRSREVSREELYALFAERLSVPATHAVSEYGMSEMASQFYDSSLADALAGKERPARKVAPPWLRTRLIDPLTGKEAAPGGTGVLAHYDLANLNSVLAIQTEDAGHGAPDGDGFILEGRAAGAMLRGCSLTAEEMAGRLPAPAGGKP